MFSRNVLLSGLCFLFLAASVTVQAASAWGPRTLHPNELYTISGGGLHPHKCCKRSTVQCKFDEQDERECELDIATSACKWLEAVEVEPGNKEFCLGDNPGHACSEDVYDEPIKCQETWRCAWNIWLTTPCYRDYSLGAENAAEACTPSGGCP